MKILVILLCTAIAFQIRSVNASEQEPHTSEKAAELNNTRAGSPLPIRFEYRRTTSPKKDYGIIAEEIASIDPTMRNLPVAKLSEKDEALLEEELTRLDAIIDSIIDSMKK